jgi:hypothetical protein
VAIWSKMLSEDKKVERENSDPEELGAFWSRRHWTIWLPISSSGSSRWTVASSRPDRLKMRSPWAAPATPFSIHWPAISPPRP